MTNDIWTAKQVAEHLGVSRSYVYLLAKRQTLPARRIGRTYCFAPDDVANWRKARPARNFESRDLWGVRRLAKFLRMPDAWIVQNAQRGVLPAYRVGPCLRFDEREVRQWLHQQRVAPAEAA